MNNILDTEATLKPAAVDEVAGATVSCSVEAVNGDGAAGAVGLEVVLYDGLKVEGLIVGGVTVQKRNIIQLANLHAQVVQKTANNFDSMQSMDMYNND